MADLVLDVTDTVAVKPVGLASGVLSPSSPLSSPVSAQISTLKRLMPVMLRGSGSTVKETGREERPPGSR